MIIGVQGKPPHNMNQNVSFIAKIFISVMFVVIIEGALRKWVSQELTNYLVLLRDVLAFYTILWAIRNRNAQLRTQSMTLLFLWSILVLFWGLIQSLINQSGFISLLLGYRFWLLYLVFVCVATMCITEYDFKIIIKFCQLTLLVMLPLVVFQHFQPPTAFINKQLDDDSFIFQVVEGVVRTTGTFSFTVGYSAYVSIVTPFMLSLAIPGMNFWRQKWVPFLAFFFIAIAVLVSGSRTSILFFGFVFAIHIVFLLFFSKRRSITSAFFVMILLVFTIGLGPFIFSTAVEATKERFVGAAEIESFSGRSLELFVGNSELFKDFSLVGAGLGKGVNYAGASRESDREFLLGEYEIERTVRAGGILGLLFFILKVFIALHGLTSSFRILKRFGNSLPLMLWSTTTLAIFIWAITGQLSINALGFILFGMALMSLRFPSIRA